jgi:hypothetical protein
MLKHLQIDTPSLAPLGYVKMKTNAILEKLAVKTPMNDFAASPDQFQGYQFHSISTPLPNPLCSRICTKTWKESDYNTEN